MELSFYKGLSNNVFLPIFYSFATASVTEIKITLAMNKFIIFLAID